MQTDLPLLGQFSLILRSPCVQYHLETSSAIKNVAKKWYYKYICIYIYIYTQKGINVCTYPCVQSTLFTNAYTISYISYHNLSFFSMIIIYIYIRISDQLKKTTTIYYHWHICYYPLCRLPLQLLAAYHLRLCPLSLTLSTGGSRFSRFSRLSRPVGRP